METNIKLHQFLLELLSSNQYTHIIRWTNNDGEFKLLDAQAVARLWGLRKNRHNMNYDKLSRALRCYYKKDIIRKVRGQKFVYRFVSFPEIAPISTSALGSLQTVPIVTFISPYLPQGMTPLMTLPFWSPFALPSPRGFFSTSGSGGTHLQFPSTHMGLTSSFLPLGPFLGHPYSPFDPQVNDATTDVTPIDYAVRSSV